VNDASSSTAGTDGASDTADADGASDVAGAGGTNDASSDTADANIGDTRHDASGNADAHDGGAGAAGEDAANDSGSTSADAHDASVEMATDASVDRATDTAVGSSTAERGAACLAQVVASGAYHATNILARRNDGTVSMYQQFDQVSSQGIVIPDTSAHFREILKADQTPFRASDVGIAATDISSTLGNSVIGCGVVSGNVWCFRGGPVNSVFLGGGFGPYDTLYWPVEVVTAVGGPPLANVQQLTGLGAPWGPIFCAVTADGSISCWGSGHSGQLGRGDDLTDASFARPVLADAATPFSNAAEVRLGYQTACARKTDGSVWCWGTSDSGEVPGPRQRAPYPVRVSLPGSGDQAISTRLISAANSTWCSIMKDTSVVCWGDNTSGQAGQPVDYNQRPPVVQPGRVLTSVAGPPLLGVSDVIVAGTGPYTYARTSALDVVYWVTYPQDYLDDAKTAVSGARLPLAATGNGPIYVDAKGLLRSDGKVLQSQPCPAQ
jgi:hypothetical protein